MVQSLTDPDDFRRLLQRRPLARHAGWSLHAQKTPAVELSTGGNSTADGAVDECPASLPPFRIRTGVVLSRRNVRRAASRNLMRRIWRDLLSRGPDGRFEGWDLLVRRTAPWSRSEFPSTQSDPMRRRLRDDFETLLAFLPAAGVRP